MNSVVRVKAICAERKIPISKLEKDLGFSNGYISQLRKGTFPADRLAKIAQYLSLSTSYLLYGKDDDAQGSDPDIRRIERARSHMTSTEKDEMMRVLEISFKKFFSDDFEDDDLDE